MTDDVKEPYADVKSVLSNQRSIRAFVRTVDFDWLLEVQEKLTAAMEERRTEVEMEKLELEEREKQRQELLELITAKGFDVNTLLTPADQVAAKPRQRKASVNRKPKYQYRENGELKFWAGVGRKPKPIQAAVESGTPLESFLIPENQSS